MAPVYCRGRDKTFKYYKIWWLFWIDQEKSSLAVEIELCNNIFHIYKILYLSFKYILYIYSIYCIYLASFQAAKGYRRAITSLSSFALYLTLHILQNIGTLQC